MLSIPQQELIELYSVNQWSMEKIGKHFGCGIEAIRRRLHKLQVKIRPREFRLHPQRTDITKDFLVKEYFENHKTMKKIAEQVKCSEAIVHRYFHRYKLKPRTKHEALIGIKRTPEQCNRIGIAARARGLFGEKCANWKGGISFDKTAIRRNFRYQSFRRRVLNARGNICEKCGRNLREKCTTCGHLPDRHVHHIKPFSRYEEERFSETNVLVICDSCHKFQHSKRN